MKDIQRVAFDAVPAELRERDQWVCWKLEHNAQGKLTKVPYHAGTGARASTTDPTTWTSFDRAVAASSRYSGIGYVLTVDDQFIGIDLDHCHDPLTGAWEPWATHVIDACGSYTERSPSRTGAHVFIRGTLPPNARHVYGNLSSTADVAGKLEVYAWGRYFTVTGVHVEGTPREICRSSRPLADILDAIAPAALATGAKGAGARAASVAPRMEDDAVLSLARQATNGQKFISLWNGDAHTYHGGDESAADLALCSLLAFYTGGDVAQVDRLFRRSALYREKWDERRGAQTYGAMTISKAIAGCSQTYTGSSAVELSEIQPGPAKPPWPELASDALYGLAGRIVEVLDPFSEGDPVATLVHLLVAVGNLFGAGPHASVLFDVHPCRLNAGIVGVSGKGRKGLSWSTPRHLLSQVDAEWAKHRIKNSGGLSSGEGLIYHVRDARDEQQPVKEKGRVVGYETVRVDEGELDKRLLVIEPELAVVLKRMAGEGNSLSGIIRSAWDSGDLNTLTKNSPLRATGAHISIIGHITTDELRRYLTETERANGFANRFLWLLARRSKEIPTATAPPEELLEPLTAQLRRAVAHASQVHGIPRDDEAEAAWHSVYGPLSSGQPGMVGAITNRGEAQVLRLSLIYALLDCSSVVRPAHLGAALAVWDYAKASAELIFGGKVGDPVADTILTTLRARGVLTRTEISGLFGRHHSADRIELAVALLERSGCIRRSTQSTLGRPREVWSLIG